MRVATAFLLLAGLAGVGSPASAAVIFSQGFDTTEFGLNSNGPDSIPTSPVVSDHQVADDFALAGATQLTSVSWFGSYHDDSTPATAKAFKLRIFSSLAGTGTIIFDTDVSIAGIDTGSSNALGDSIMSYSAAISPAALAAGTYFMSVLENDATTDSIWTWSGSGGSAFRRFGEAGTWDGAAQLDVAFALEGNATAAPEPATLVLLSLALAGLVGSRRKPSRQAAE